MKLKLIASALATAFALQGCAMLVAGIAGDGGAVARLDRNGDGVISRAEAKGSSLEDEFAFLDKNRDGMLSADEASVAGSATGRNELAQGTTGGTGSAAGSGSTAATGTPGSLSAGAGSTSPLR